MPDEQRFVMIREPERLHDYPGITIYDTLSKRIGPEYHPNFFRKPEEGWRVLDQLRFGEMHVHQIHWDRLDADIQERITVIENAG